jgi:hypothetical protein
MAERKELECSFVEGKSQKLNLLIAGIDAHL